MTRGREEALARQLANLESRLGVRSNPVRLPATAYEPVDRRVRSTASAATASSTVAPSGLPPGGPKTVSTSRDAVARREERRNRYPNIEEESFFEAERRSMARGAAGLNPGGPPQPGAGVGTARDAAMRRQDNSCTRTRPRR